MPQRPTGPSVSQDSASLMQLWFQTTPLPCYSSTRDTNLGFGFYFIKKIFIAIFFSANILEFILLDFFLIHVGLPHPSVTQDSTLE